jgi:hypothetical protein
LPFQCAGFRDQSTCRELPSAPSPNPFGFVAGQLAVFQGASEARVTCSKELEAVTGAIFNLFKQGLRQLEPKTAGVQSTEF